MKKHLNYAPHKTELDLQKCIKEWYGSTLLNAPRQSPDEKNNSALTMLTRLLNDKTFYNDVTTMLNGDNGENWIWNELVKLNEIYTTKETKSDISNTLEELAPLYESSEDLKGSMLKIIQEWEIQLNQELHDHVTTEIHRLSNYIGTGIGDKTSKFIEELKITANNLKVVDLTITCLKIEDPNVINYYLDKGVESQHALKLNENTFTILKNNYLQTLLTLDGVPMSQSDISKTKETMNLMENLGINVQEECLKLKSLKQPPLLSAEDHFSTQPNNVEPSSIEM